MNRLFVCFLLCLMPLRLWAGAGMNVTGHAGHLSQAPQQARLAADMVHPCHETVAEAFHEADEQLPAPEDTVHLKAGCQDGACQLCAVCHQSTGPAAWLWLQPQTLVHPLPASPLWAHAVCISSPLTRPPIS